MQTVIIKNVPELEAFAHEFASSLRGGEVIGLVGDLGAGKTTFVQMLAAALGVESAVKSPTFILMQVLPTARRTGAHRLCHVDAYRLKDWEELAAIGFEEYAGEARTVTLVEWADRVPEIHKFPAYQELTFAFGPGEGRTLRLEGGQP
ncbi:MAG TPA: tRNA (adenosine(37)-N6)-threonylcarbamoyltransferase complex ATPase subunit type 1 TsaE [Candidatus Binatia bacterium]|nr:tRNA (adenosine(37)-N6)-threonylcarbamoyltransferase complex ATPase subunit type 1 TsaE [Candidatus Binatia bacterium]